MPALSEIRQALQDGSVPVPQLWFLMAGLFLLACYRLRAGVLVWSALAGTVIVPLLTVRNAAVYPAAAYLAALLALWAGAIATRRAVLPRSTITVPLLAVAAATVASCVQGMVFRDPSIIGVHRFALVQVYASALVLLSVGAALLVAGVFANQHGLRWLCASIVAVAALLMARILFGWETLPAPRWWPLIVAHGAALTYALLLFDLRRPWWQQVFGAAFVVCAFYELIADPFLRPGHSQWVSGWLMIGVAVGFITLVRFPRASILAGIPIAIALGVVVYPKIVQVYDLAVSEGDFGRLTLWRDALRFALMRPYLGIGPGNYLDYAERYAELEIALGSAHGNYQQLVAEMGLVGLAFVLWVFVRVYAVGARLLRQIDAAAPRAVVVGIMGALAGQLSAAVFGDYLIPAYHNGGHLNLCATIYTWMLIGVLMAIEGRRELRTSAGP